MKIDDLMFRFRMQAEAEAIARGEPPPQPKPITFDTVQELIQKGQLSSAEAILLDHLLEQVEQTPGGQIKAAEARAAREARIASLRAQLSELRSQLTEQATPDAQLREYAPGEPVPRLSEGPVLPLHGAILGQRLPGEGDDEGKS